MLCSKLNKRHDDLVTLNQRRVFGRPRRAAVAARGAIVFIVLKFWRSIYVLFCFSNGFEAAELSTEYKVLWGLQALFRLICFSGHWSLKHLEGWIDLRKSVFNEGVSGLHGSCLFSDRHIVYIGRRIEKSTAEVERKKDLRTCACFCCFIAIYIIEFLNVFPFYNTLFLFSECDWFLTGCFYSSSDCVRWTPPHYYCDVCLEHKCLGTPSSYSNRIYWHFSIYITDCSLLFTNNISPA